MIELILVYSLVLLAILFIAGVLSPKFEKWVQNFLDNENDFRKREIEKIKRIIKKVLAKKKHTLIDEGEYVKIGDDWIQLPYKLRVKTGRLIDVSAEPIEKEEPRWTEYELELISEIDDAFINYINRKCPAGDDDIEVYRSFAKGEYEYNNWIKAIDECIFLSDAEVKLIDEIRKTRNDIAVDFKNDFGKFYNVKLKKIKGR